MLTTRPESDSDLLREHLQNLGAEVVNHPLTEFSPPALICQEIREISGRIGEFSMLVLLSRRGVMRAHALMGADSLMLKGRDPRNSNRRDRPRDT